MNTSSRRTFVLQLAAGGTAVVATPLLAQPAAPRLDEKDPQAAALGYLADTTKVDGKKYPKHTNDQRCSNCQVYGGKPKEAAGPCPIFAGKSVSANGWCSAWVKKA